MRFHWPNFVPKKKCLARYKGPKQLALGILTGYFPVAATLEPSSVLSGLSPLLQISHSVVPKLHLSAAKLRFWGLSMHSGATQGTWSTRTERGRGSGTRLHAAAETTRPRDHALTFSGQHADADARVAQLDEGQAPRGPVLLPDQEHVLGAHLPVNQVLVLLGVEKQVSTNPLSSLLVCQRLRCGTR